MNHLSRTQRLDRLPYTRKHNKLLMGSGVGWALDAMDIGLISFIMAALVKEWGLGDTELSVLGSIAFVGMAVGASVGGLLADRIGRRQVFAITLLVYGVATGLSALSTGLVMLVALRFIVGIGLGAELPVASTLVSEFAPRRIRDASWLHWSRSGRSAGWPLRASAISSCRRWTAAGAGPWPWVPSPLSGRS